VSILTGKSTVRDIYESLRMRIITGAIPSETRMTEEWLAGKFGVSRTPIREALRMLESEQLIRLARSKGATVNSLNRQDVIDTYQCRGNLRGLACRLAAEHMTPLVLSQLAHLLETFEQAVEKEQFDPMVRSIFQFNRVVAETAGNRVLTELLNTLDDRTFRLRYMAFTIPGRVRFSLDAYRRLYAAFAACDGSTAESIMHSIMQNAKEAILQVYYPQVPDGLVTPSPLKISGD
jgi:DNA-binding GntR family transcriptional regulator